MLRTVPVSSSVYLTKRHSFLSRCPLRSCCNNNSRIAEASDCNFSRRLALIHLGTAMPQSQVLGVKASELLRPAESTTGVNSLGNVAQVSTDEDSALQWAKNDRRRMLHVVYRVGDLDRTVKFYTECLGMKLLRKRDIPKDRYSNAFLGYGPEDSYFTVELTYNYGVNKYDIGTGFGHIGVGVKDVVKAVNLVSANGGRVTKEPRRVDGGMKLIAYVEDPDGYKFELLEEGAIAEPLRHVMLYVGNLNQSIDFYRKAFGMDLLSKVDNPVYKCTEATLGYGPEDSNPAVKLTYQYGVTEYGKGNGYAQIAIGTNDVYKTAEAIKLCGGKIVLEPGPLPGINTKIMACLDPDGWKSVFVDNVDFLKELD